MPTITKLIMTLPAAFAAMLAVSLVPAAAQANKPNLVLMLADDLGYGDVSSYNGGIRGGMRTPRIDQLAAERMRFTQFRPLRDLH